MRALDDEVQRAGARTPAATETDRVHLRRARLCAATARVGLLGALLGTWASCGPGTSSANDFCPLVDGQGGDPSNATPEGQTWKVDASCQVRYARTASPEWCSQLVYSERGVKDGLFLGQEFLPIVYVENPADPTDRSRESTITYTRDPNCGQNCGTYSARLVFEGKTTTYFPAGCLDQHMASPTCADLAAKIQTLADQAIPIVEMVECTPGQNAGDCSCSYLVTTSTLTVDVGLWRIEGGLLTHYPGTLVQPSVADFSVTDNMMQLHGHDGTGLLGHDPVRTLILSKL
jgi:hypothetical protein